MFNKYQGVFRSRWKAVLWAIGVCFTAYCTVPSEDGSLPGESLLGLGAPKEAPSHAAVDPWAIDKKQG